MIYNTRNQSNDTTKGQKKKRPVLTLFRMGLFGDAHGWRGKKAPLPKICHTYSTMMNLGTVIPYLKKILEKY